MAWRQTLGCSISLASPSDYWPAGLKGTAAEKVRVTDAQPGGGKLVTHTEGKDEEGGDAENLIKMEQLNASS